MPSLLVALLFVGFTSVESAIADEDGIKHILLCRVLLGKTELVSRGSKQSHPSSEDFQSGVDDLVSPKKYIVWSSQMNTHILPEFVISFKTLTSMNSQPFQECDQVPKLDGVPVCVKKPISPWIPIPELIAALSKILPPKAIKEITQFRRSYIEHKIPRCDMIRGIRKITGDRLLLTVLKNFNEQVRIHFLVVKRFFLLETVNCDQEYNMLEHSPIFKIQSVA
ncbi:putative poly(ADP-ribose) polymerase, catalytic domain, RST domain-containing protein [Helianthus annuus]|nr:putative poly(ADP-ribose) polymerase, catalytic domain, RST domain-containing protein [Helianthus annuus]KAJ0709188.1 putative poly(ADP-ribose) polymerase, catalytic domain, RST domain-containing protein [Helianthus annuus]KAJ0713069.1 putative poly(ADP-ribose) polymerase, catalytic domain, RST domain-containing protein [Helianthus annuus]KAJ0895101.1 putative poly(ADP-ribose) polymerase, catalytic domain, RST domain of plant [Helianthus annuus]